jgi:GntR family transcriptional repressor for pyruvate dehydrogenase complex
LKRQNGNEEAVFSPLRHAPAYKALSAAIERKILARELRSGDMLPPEQQLAEQFRVNRSTVREAIRQLEQEGLVIRGAGRRLHVAVPGVHELAPRTTRALLLQQVTFTQLWEVAMMLEPQAAAMAANRRTEEDLVRLEANVEAMAHAVARGDSFTELDIDFHAGIALASHNWVLILAREPVNLLFRPTMDQLRTAMPQAADRNLEAHRRILAAIRDSNQGGAQIWARKHLTDFQRGYRIADLDMDDVVRWNAD